MRAAKGRRNIERTKNEKTGTDVFAGAVMGEMFDPPVDRGRAYIRYVRNDLFNNSTFKSDLVVGLACFYYVVLLTLPKDQAAGSYSRVFHSLYVQGWLATEIKNLHMNSHIEFAYVWRLVFFDELHIGPKIEDMVTSLPSGPMFAKQEHTSHVVKLCCLCLGHVVPKLPCGTLGCPGESTAGVGLSYNIESLQSYSLSSSAEQNFFTSAESISSCIEILDEFADEVIQSCYDLWPSVVFHANSQK